MHDRRVSRLPRESADGEVVREVMHRSHRPVATAVPRPLRHSCDERVRFFYILRVTHLQGRDVGRKLAFSWRSACNAQCHTLVVCEFATIAHVLPDSLSIVLDDAGEDIRGLIRVECGEIGWSGPGLNPVAHVPHPRGIVIPHPLVIYSFCGIVVPWAPRVIYSKPHH